jgi:DNA-binding CsgD family transcriptional regulator
MSYKEVKKQYSEIFQSYDNPVLGEHIKKIKELDFYLPPISTFFCITNTQNLKFEYISKNFSVCLGIDPHILKTEGMRYFWSRIHPEDIDVWLKALNDLMEFTLAEIPEDQRFRTSYTWNYRLQNGKGKYVNIIQNTTPLEFDSDNKPIIGLAHYTVMHPNIKMPITASAKLLNDQNEYETVYFNNFSQKLLANGISNRERDIVRLLVLNYSSKDIAEKLKISSNTVDTHRRNILKKLKISSTGELVGMLKMNRVLI